MGSSHYVHKVDGLLSKLYEKDPARQGVFEEVDRARLKKQTSHKRELAFKELGLKSLLREKRLLHYKGLSTIGPSDLKEESLKLLYLISCYAPPRGGWMRHQAISVLLYEGIMAGTFDFDYSPKSENIQGCLLYINVSQEGEDALADLQALGMTCTLLLSTHQHNVANALQVSEDGAKLLTSWRNTKPEAHAVSAEKVHRLIYRAKDGSRPPVLPTKDTGPQIASTLVVVDWDMDNECFVLSNKAGFRSVSTITEIEDVTYVCSPYIPRCIQTGIPISEMPRNNRDIAAKVVEALRKKKIAGEYESYSSIRDHKLTEVLRLSNVKVLVSEWIPFGRNHMGNLIRKLGADKRTQGGMFTTSVDNRPGGTIFEYDFDKVGNCIHVLDYLMSQHINFLADITTPEDDGIVQIEEFGVHVHFDGTVMYGLEVNSVMESLEHSLSMDKLARLLVDIQQDSSFLTFSITTAYQRVLMDTMSGGSSLNREKYNFIVADSVAPRLSAEECLDNISNKMELQQLIGILQASHSINGEMLLVIGSTGMLVVGGAVAAYERIIVAYLCLKSREMGMDRFVNRLFHVGDTLQELRQCVIKFSEDPGSLDKMSLLQSEILHEIINLQEVLSQIIEGLDLQHSILGELSIPGMTAPIPSGATVLSTPAASLPPISSEFKAAKAHREFVEARGKRKKHTENPAMAPKPMVAANLEAVLGVAKLHANLKLRCSDMAIHLQGARAELDSLRHMTAYITGQESYKLSAQVQSNTRNLEDVFRANERSSSSLEIMQVILAGSLAFDILDRCAIMYLSVDPGKYYQWLVRLIQLPMAWFLINFIFWLVMSFMLVRFMQFLASKAHGIFTVRLTLNIPIKTEGLAKMLLGKEVQMEDLMVEENSFIRQCTYQDKSKVWKGETVKIDLTYDEKSGHLLKAYLQVPKACNFQNVGEVQNAFFKELIQKKALTKETVMAWNRAAFDTQKKIQRKLTRLKSVTSTAGEKGAAAQLAHPPVRQALGLNKMGSPPSGTDITANKGGEVVPLLPAMPMEYWDPSQSVSGAEGDSARWVSKEPTYTNIQKPEKSRVG